MQLEKIVNLKSVISFSILTLLIDLVIILSVYSRLPDLVPSHFDGNFNPTNYSGKSIIFLFWIFDIIILLAVNVAFIVVKRFYPSIAYIVGMIVFAQSLMTLIDTIRTILLSMFPKRNYNLSWAEYTVLLIILALIITFYYKKRLIKPKVANKE